MLVFGTQTEGPDWLIGDDADDFIGGWGGDDLIMGGGGNDLLLGNHGDDVIVPGAGLDSIWGGFLNGDSGNDSVSYGFYGSGVYANLALGYGYQMSAGLAADKDTYHGIENITGSNHNDILVGDGGANKLWGNGGHDWMLGQAGNDTLNGGGGDDSLTGGAGADNLNGGSGIDMVSYSDSPSSVFVNLASGSGLYGDAQGDVIAEVENLQGSAFNDTLLGNDSANKLMGLAGIDSLYGLAGDDQLEGGAGNDTLSGGANNDTLVGGTGKDTMTGGTGGDKFIFANADIVLGIANADVITDFSSAQGDKIDLTKVDGNEYIAGIQDFVFIPGDDFSGTPGEVCFNHQNGNTIITGNTDNDDDTDFVIVLTGVHNLTANDFIL